MHHAKKNSRITNITENCFESNVQIFTYRNFKEKIDAKDLTGSQSQWQQLVTGFLCINILLTVCATDLEKWWGKWPNNLISTNHDGRKHKFCWYSRVTGKWINQCFHTVTNTCLCLNTTMEITAQLLQPTPSIQQTSTTAKWACVTIEMHSLLGNIQRNQSKVVNKLLYVHYNTSMTTMSTRAVTFVTIMPKEACFMNLVFFLYQKR